MKTFFIYGLYDPAEPLVFRYVGQASSLRKRLSTHGTQLQAWNGVPAQWKWSVGLFGRKFQMAMIDVVCGVREDAFAAEQYHLQRLAPHHRLDNAHMHRRRNMHVPRLVYDIYLRNIVALQAMATANGPQLLQSSRFIAGTLSDIEHEYPSMRLCTKSDCYSASMEEFWKKSGRTIDGFSVSR
jgi:hypothetical protein